MSDNFLSIIVPFYNEKWNIKPLLKDFLEFSSIYDFELIFVNDGSKDGTKEILEDLIWKYDFLKIVSYDKNKWYGWAILSWLDSSSWNILWWMHSDIQTDTKYIFEAYEKILNEKKIVIKWKRVNRKLSQIIFSYTMWLICSMVFFKKLFEINAQPKVFRRELYSLFKNPPHDFSLDLYLLVLAFKNGYNIKNIKVNYINRIYWTSKWSFSLKTKIKTIFRTLKYILKLRIWLK